MWSLKVAVLCMAVLVAFPTTNSVFGKNTPSRNLGFSCFAGRPGIPGLHGKPGAPGRDGRDGRAGTPGKRGLPGLDGAPVTGSQGKPGSPGSPGPKGPLGTKGDAGPKGQKGEPGLRGLSSHSNWKECSWKNGNGKDNGLIKSCVFQKKQSNSFLRVYFNGALRIHNCYACCKRWFFTFNGAECKAPLAIDGVVYMAKGNGAHIKDLHRVRHIEGHCGKIHKGHVRVGFNVGNCAGYGSADAYTGWNSNSRLYIEEVPRPQA